MNDHVYALGYQFPLLMPDLQFFIRILVLFGLCGIFFFFHFLLQVIMIDNKIVKYNL